MRTVAFPPALTGISATARTQLTSNSSATQLVYFIISSLTFGYQSSLSRGSMLQNALTLLLLAVACVAAVKRRLSNPQPRRAVTSNTAVTNSSSFTMTTTTTTSTTTTIPSSSSSSSQLSLGRSLSQVSQSSSQDSSQDSSQASLDSLAAAKPLPSFFQGTLFAAVC